VQNGLITAVWAVVDLIAYLATVRSPSFYDVVTLLILYFSQPDCEAFPRRYSNLKTKQLLYQQAPRVQFPTGKTLYKFFDVESQLSRWMEISDEWRDGKEKSEHGKWHQTGELRQLPRVFDLA
jgi:hypothetical protein